MGNVFESVSLFVQQGQTFKAGEAGRGDVLEVKTER